MSDLDAAADANAHKDEHPCPHADQDADAHPHLYTNADEHPEAVSDRYLDANPDNSDKDIDAHANPDSHPDADANNPNTNSAATSPWQWFLLEQRSILAGLFRKLHD
jgi:hypothetical protein